MFSPSPIGCDSDVAKLEGNFTKAAIALDTGKLTFLDLPMELRVMVYEYFTPEDQYIFNSGQPAYDGLLRTCKQIRTEALKEIQKAADKYYRAYEASWLLEEGFSIKVEPIIDPGKVVVVFSEDHFIVEEHVELTNADGEVDLSPPPSILHIASSNETDLKPHVPGLL
ncbi:unnamed protein product [Alternaria alternata]